MVNSLKSLYQINSLIEINLYPFLYSSPLFSLNQINLHKGDMAWIGVPVAVYMAIPCSGFLSLEAISELLLSAQVIIGANGLQCSSTTIKLCIALLKLIADGCVPILSIISLMIAANALQINSRFCSW